MWERVNQVVAVAADDWDSTAALVTGCERDADGAWRVALPPTPAVVGRNGLGWGRGVHDRGWVVPGEPEKMEGDGRAPAGMFELLGVFGAAPTAPAAIRMPYQPCTPQLRWVDDPESLFYNQPVEVFPGEDEGWRSAEVMAREDGLYQLGVVVGHNTHPVEPGAGSCIFIHVWKGPLQGTSGCTAMALESLERLAAWLDPEARPVMIQLPRALFQRVGSLNELPLSCILS